MARYPTLGYYVQGDPRGCALYILRPGDVPEGSTPDCCYSRGIAVLQMPPLHDHDGKLFTVIRHGDGCYSFAIGVPRDYEWTASYHVVGVYETRREAVDSENADRKAQEEMRKAGDPGRQTETVARETNQ